MEQKFNEITSALTKKLADLAAPNPAIVPNFPNIGSHNSSTTGFIVQLVKSTVKAKNLFSTL
uniref:Uncharacterized protein n=1 Tax=Romanomermis culicivorax TaxID=13658 RepID=A0A915J072_ROMCU